jgi:hypothetical protein
MAQLSASGSIYPTLVTSCITAVLTIWALYALSGAGAIPELPFIRLALCVITGIYLLRGVAGLVLAMVAPSSNGPAFWWWSSVICFTIGAVHFVGTRQAWFQLSRVAT